MEKIAAAYRSDLALREKSCERDRSQPFRHRLRVMIYASEQALPASTATEHQCAESGIAMDGPIGCEQEVQIVARRSRVTQMELDGLAFLDHVPDRDGASLVIGSDEIADQKISPFKASALLVDDNADVQGSVGSATVFLP
jgi:hypothetical protein